MVRRNQTWFLASRAKCPTKEAKIKEILTWQTKTPTVITAKTERFRTQRVNGECGLMVVGRGEAEKASLRKCHVSSECSHVGSGYSRKREELV